MRFNRKFLYFASITGLVACLGCATTTGQQTTASEQPKAEALDPLLKNIPADTAYLFAMLQPMPKAFTEMYGRQAATEFDSAADLLEKIYSAQESDESKLDPDDRMVLSLMRELRGKLSPEGISQIGIDYQNRMAVYTHGLWPIFRIELTDTNKFKAFVDRLFQIGKVVPVQKKTPAGDVFSLQFEPIGLAWGYQDSQLVLGMTLSEHLDEVASGLLQSISDPKKSIGSGQHLQSLQAKYGFDKTAVGYVDFQPLYQQLVPQAAASGRPAGAQAETLSPVCKTEISTLLNTYPRVVFGYRTVNDSEVDGDLILETKATWVSELAGLHSSAVRLPGDSHAKALISFELGLDGARLLDWARAKAEDLNAKPYGCEHLQFVNEVAGDLAGPIQHPAYNAIRLVKSFGIVLEKLQMKGPIPSELSAYLLLGMDQPSALLELLKSMVPGLDQLSLKPDGQAVSAPPQLTIPMVGVPQVAMGRHGLAVGLGKGMSGLLSSMVQADPAASESMFKMGMDYSRWQALQRKMMEAAVASADGEPVKPAEVVAGHHVFSQFLLSLVQRPTGLALNFKMGLGQAAKSETK